jgi:hypothetical protein
MTESGAGAFGDLPEGLPPPTSSASKVIFIISVFHFSIISSVSKRTSVSLRSEEDIEMVKACPSASLLDTSLTITLSPDRETEPRSSRLSLLA